MASDSEHHYDRQDQQNERDLDYEYEGDRGERKDRRRKRDDFEGGDEDRRRTFRGKDGKKKAKGSEVKFGKQQPGGTAAEYKKNRILNHVEGLFTLGDFTIIRLTDLEDLYGQNYENFNQATQRIGYSTTKEFLRDYDEFKVESNGDGVYWVRLSRMRSAEDKEPLFASIDRPDSSGPLSSTERYDPEEIEQLREKRKRRARVLALRIGRIFPRSKPRIRFTNLIDVYSRFFRRHGPTEEEAEFPELDSTDLLQTLKSIGFLKLRRYLCWYPELFSVEETKAGVLNVHFLGRITDEDETANNELDESSSHPSSSSYSSSSQSTTEEIPVFASSTETSSNQQVIADNIIQLLQDKTGKEIRMASLIGAYRKHYRKELMRDIKRLGYTKLKLFLGEFPNTFGIRGEMGSEHVYLTSTTKPNITITRSNPILVLPTSSVAPVLRSIVTTTPNTTADSKEKEKVSVPTLTISTDQQTIVYRNDFVKKEELVFPERLPRKKASDYFDIYIDTEGEESDYNRNSFEEENERTKKSR